MNPDFVQDLRWKLQKRLSTLRSSGYRVFHSQLLQSWKWLNQYDIFQEALKQLEQCESCRAEVDAKFTGEDFPYSDDPDKMPSISLLVLQRCIESKIENIEANFGYRYNRMAHTVDEAHSGFIFLYVKPLFDFLDEFLSNQRFVATLLLRYKQKCEWFQRKSLYDLWRDAPKGSGEKVLKDHLLEWLFDQGFDIIKEPSSASGEVDLIAIGVDRFVIEAKIFNPNKGYGKTYIAEGFKQTYDYLEDFNEAIGYMVIFKTSLKDLKIESSAPAQPIPTAVYNNKTIVMMTVDVSEKPTASRNGVLEPIIITEDDLIRPLAQND
jgi:hypothetical protein